MSINLSRSEIIQVIKIKIFVLMSEKNRSMHTRTNLYVTDFTSIQNLLDYLYPTKMSELPPLPYLITRLCNLLHF